MNPVRNHTQKVLIAIFGICILFFLQFFVASHIRGFFFFPAAVFYIATFLPFPHTLILGFMAGSALDSFSLLPFGTHILIMGGTMASASFFMQMVDERRLIARAAVACLLFGGYALLSGLAYVITRRGLYVSEFPVFDLAMGIGFLIITSAGHAFLKKYTSYV